ncbi:S8 family serine peptidase [Streptomyces sp. NPDC002913]
MTRWRSVSLVGACAALLLAALASPAGAEEPAPRGTVRGTDNPFVVDGSYIVVLKRDAPQAKEGKAKSLTGRFGWSVRRTFGSALNGFTVQATATKARRIASDPSVAFVEQDSVEYAVATQPSPTRGLDRIDQTNLPLSKSGTSMATPHVTGSPNLLLNISGL